jgi:hypothetical protein
MVLESTLQNMGLPEVWGATEAEMAERFPCDEIIEGPAEQWFRAVPTVADPAVQYRWLCQLTVAPYSYDLIDNHGRRSPRTLTPGLADLTVGQPMIRRLFTLADFTPGRDLTLHLTDRATKRLFGDVAITYRAEPGRLVAKLAVGARPGLLSFARRRFLAWGDLVMMRRQLTTLAKLAAS